MKSINFSKFFLFAFAVLHVPMVYAQPPSCKLDGKDCHIANVKVYVQEPEPVEFKEDDGGEVKNLRDSYCGTLLREGVLLANEFAREFTNAFRILAKKDSKDKAEKEKTIRQSNPFKQGSYDDNYVDAQIALWTS